MDEDAYVKFLRKRTLELTIHLDSLFTSTKPFKILQLKNNPSIFVNKPIQSSKSDIDMEALESKLALSEKKFLRLKEAFQSQLTVYKTHILNILGYSLETTLVGDVIVAIDHLVWTFRVERGYFIIV